MTVPLQYTIIKSEFPEVNGTYQLVDTFKYTKLDNSSFIVGKFEGFWMVCEERNKTIYDYCTATQRSSNMQYVKWNYNYGGKWFGSKMEVISSKTFIVNNASGAAQYSRKSANVPNSPYHPNLPSPQVLTLASKQTGQFVTSENPLSQSKGNQKTKAEQTPPPSDVSQTYQSLKSFDDSHLVMIDELKRELDKLRAKDIMQTTNYNMLLHQLDDLKKEKSIQEKKCFEQAADKTKYVRTLEAEKTAWLKREKKLIEECDAYVQELALARHDILALQTNKSGKSQSQTQDQILLQADIRQLTSRNTAFNERIGLLEDEKLTLAIKQKELLQDKQFLQKENVRLRDENYLLKNKSSVLPVSLVSHVSTSAPDSALLEKIRRLEEENRILESEKMLKFESNRRAAAASNSTVEMRRLADDLAVVERERDDYQKDITAKNTHIQKLEREMQTLRAAPVASTTNNKTIAKLESELKVQTNNVAKYQAAVTERDTHIGTLTTHYTTQEKILRTEYENTIQKLQQTHAAEHAALLDNTQKTIKDTLSRTVERTDTLMVRSGKSYIKRDMQQNNFVSLFPAGDIFVNSFNSAFMGFDTFTSEVCNVLELERMSTVQAGDVLVSKVMVPLYNTCVKFVSDELRTRKDDLHKQYGAVVDENTPEQCDTMFWYAHMQPLVLAYIDGLSKDYIVDTILSAPAQSLNVKMERAVQTGVIDGGARSMNIPQLAQLLLRSVTICALSVPRCYLYPPPGQRVHYKDGFMKEILSPGARTHGRLKEGDEVEVVLSGLYFDQPTLQNFTVVRPREVSLVRRIVK